MCVSEFTHKLVKCASVPMSTHVIEEWTVVFCFFFPCVCGLKQHLLMGRCALGERPLCPSLTFHLSISHPSTPPRKVILPQLARSQLLGPGGRA